MEKAPFLAAMDRHIGGVEIENDFLGWRRERSNKLLNQNLVEGHRGGAIGPMLESAQGRRARQRRDAIDRRLQRQVVPQVAMVVEIFVTERQAVQALTQLCQRAVTAAPGVPRIPQDAGRRRAQSEAAVGSP